MKRKWSVDDVDKLKSNYRFLKVEELSILLNRTKSSIESKITTLSLKKSWTKEEDDILKLNYGTTNLEKIQNLLPNRTISSIYNRANVLNIKSKERFMTKYKYEINHNFFKEINNLTCYWAGFIAADGWIKSDCYCLGIKLSYKDKKQLENFKNFIETTTPIRDRIYDNKKFSQIEIYSRDIVEDLKRNFNITPKKTFTLIPPTLPDFEHKISFIVGLIDGDGSICKINNRLRIQLIGNRQIMLWCKNILTEWLKLKKTKLACTNNLYGVSMGDKNSKVFINFVPNLNIPYMNRKWKN